MIRSLMGRDLTDDQDTAKQSRKEDGALGPLVKYNQAGLPVKARVEKAQQQSVPTTHTYVFRGTNGHNGTTIEDVCVVYMYCCYFTCRVPSNRLFLCRKLVPQPTTHT